MKKITFVLSLLVTAALLLTGCNNPRAAAPAGFWPWTWGDKTLEQSLEDSCVGGATSVVIDGSTYPCPGTTTDNPPTDGPTAAGNNCGDETLQTLYLTIVNPADSPQPQIGHPSAYGETHVSGTPVCIVVDVPSDYVGVVGGFAVDNVSDGVYTGFGPGHYEFVVTDGFSLITTADWGKAEWDFRLAQADQYNWAHTHVNSGPIK
ncbi:MAG: hypothetical protein AAB574_03215 [Patescibacteria group bacterium]